MADNKKYYYMRLKENFFSSDEMLVLESVPDGYLYSNILLKLYLSSLKNNGFLLLNGCIPLNAQMISTITKHPVGVVEKALYLYQKLGLIDVLDNGLIYMSNIELMIGESSSEADRKRAARKGIEQGEIPEIIGLETYDGQMSDEHSREIEIKKDIDTDIEKEKEKEKENVVKDIVEYLNNKLGTKYRASSEKTKKHINARLSEGFTFDDFKAVIDKKSLEWGNDSKMACYLRPETLFGTKFESYLNQKVVVPKSRIEINQKQREGMVDIVDWNM